MPKVNLQANPDMPLPTALAPWRYVPFLYKLLGNHLLNLVYPCVLDTWAVIRLSRLCTFNRGPYLIKTLDKRLRILGGLPNSLGPAWAHDVRSPGCQRTPISCSLLIAATGCTSACADVFLHRHTHTNYSVISGVCSIGS